MAGHQRRHQRPSFGCRQRYMVRLAQRFFGGPSAAIDLWPEGGQLSGHQWQEIDGPLAVYHRPSAELTDGPSSALQWAYTGCRRSMVRLAQRFFGGPSAATNLWPNGGQLSAHQRQEIDGPLAVYHWPISGNRMTAQ